MTSTLGEIVPEAARRFGKRTALLIEGKSFSFVALEQESNRMANALVAAGVEAGDRVALYGAELLGVARRLLRHREDRRRCHPDQRHADT